MKASVVLHSRLRDRRLFATFTIAATLVALLVVSTIGDGPLGPGSQAFSFRPFSPGSAALQSPGPFPAASLQINYTGFGTRTFTYSITYNGSTTLGAGDGGANSGAPFTDYVYSPTPALLTARVYYHGTLVFSQNLTLA